MRPSRIARHGMVSSIDQVATGAGVDILRRGGSAADAAIATSAVLAVTSPFACGVGGDLLAVVTPPGGTPIALNASGRAGSGADPDRMRADGFVNMPLTGDIRSVPVPGCVDGWLALHARFGRLPLADVLEAARSMAADGFAANLFLAASARSVAALACGIDLRGVERPGDLVRRPGMAAALAAIAREGREGFYGGRFGEGLLQLGAGEFVPSDLERPFADWVEPARLDVWGVDLWTVPPNSQGYLTLAGAWIASQFDLGAPAEARWAHLLAEAARAAGRDRPQVLWEGADAASLLAPDRLAGQAKSIDPDRASTGGGPWKEGGTIHLCAVDAERMGVSMTQSNARGYGCHLGVDGIFLHNRGLGFSLVKGHPAEYGPGRRPPHTLSPATVTERDGRLHTVLGTMGGDGQPQILLQLLARLIGVDPSLRQDPAAALQAGRWTWSGGPTAFDTWDGDGPSFLEVEGNVPPAWVPELRERGHQVVEVPGMASSFGHAHVIRVHDGYLEGASDPRALPGDAAGY